MSDKLTQLINLAADQCEKAGIPCGGEHGGPLHRWVVANCRHNPGADFWIVFLLSAELADREARREGVPESR